MAPHPKIYGICIFNKHINLMILIINGGVWDRVRVIILFWVGGGSTRNSFQMVYVVSRHLQQYFSYIVQAGGSFHKHSYD